MPASEMRDPKYQQEVTPPEDPLGIRYARLFIINREGTWCDIPCAHSPQTLELLAQEYVKPRFQKEILTLEEIRRAAEKQFTRYGRYFYSEDPEEYNPVELGLGLFLYGTDEEVSFDGFGESPQWESELLEHMEKAGLDLSHPVPLPLRPSVLPSRENYFNYSSPVKYDVPSLEHEIYVLAPALSLFEPGFLSGITLAIGYNAAIAIEGQALLSIMPPDDYQDVVSDIPGLPPYIFGDDIKRVLQDLML